MFNPIYHRNIAQIRPMISAADAGMLIQALISSKLGNCNAVFFGLPNSTSASLQPVHNAAARLLTRSYTFNHIAPFVSSLCWPPINVGSDRRTPCIVKHHLT